MSQKLISSIFTCKIIVILHVPIMIFLGGGNLYKNTSVYIIKLELPASQKPCKCVRHFSHAGFNSLLVYHLLAFHHTQYYYYFVIISRCFLSFQDAVICNKGISLEKLNPAC